MNIQEWATLYLMHWPAEQILEPYAPDEAEFFKNMRADCAKGVSDLIDYFEWQGLIERA